MKVDYRVRCSVCGRVLPDATKEVVEHYWEKHVEIMYFIIKDKLLYFEPRYRESFRTKTDLG